MSRPFRPDEVVTTDVLIIGGGVAGLSVALAANGRRVLLVTKKRFAGDGSSVYAQGGVAAALGPGDDPAAHARDTLAAGAGLCDPEVVRRVTAEGPRRVRELLELGARFDRSADGRLELGREAAHSRARVAHAAGDATGAEMVRTLGRAVDTSRHVTVREGLLVLELVLERGEVVGAAAVDREGRHVLIVAPEVVLAVGGIGRLWRHTTNPAEATGDGLAMAIRAGARLVNLEMMQFHPTALAAGGSPMALLTEALRGAGAVLLDERGRRFMVEEHELAELAPRDIVARAIWRRLADGGSVALDATSIPGVADRFPTVARLAAEHGFDLAAEPLPVSPAAHYHMGGIWVDGAGRTTLPGLSACGEVASTGLHGANRLASNSLLEALVCGRTVGEAVAGSLRTPLHPVRAQEIASRLGLEVDDRPFLDDALPHAGELERRLRDAMWTGAGLERSASGLRRAVDELAELAASAPTGLGELASMVLVARLVVRAATARTESRGAHFRSDFPTPCACWRQDLLVDGERLVAPRPVEAVL